MIEKALKEIIDLEKARIDEGKTPEEKARARTERNWRTARNPINPNTGRPYSQESRAVARINDIQLRGKPGVRGEKVSGRAQELDPLRHNGRYDDTSKFIQNRKEDIERIRADADKKIKDEERSIQNQKESAKRRSQDRIEKIRNAGGPGSRGGVIVGHTASGHPVYESSKHRHKSSNDVDVVKALHGIIELGLSKGGPGSGIRGHKTAKEVARAMEIDGGFHDNHIEKVKNGIKNGEPPRDQSKHFVFDVDKIRFLRLISRLENQKKIKKG